MQKMKRIVKWVGLGLWLALTIATTACQGGLGHAKGSELEIKPSLHNMYFHVRRETPNGADMRALSMPPGALQELEKQGKTVRPNGTTQFVSYWAFLKDGELKTLEIANNSDPQAAAMNYAQLEKVFSDAPSAELYYVQNVKTGVVTIGNLKPHTRELDVQTARSYSMVKANRDVQEMGIRTGDTVLGVLNSDKPEDPELYFYIGELITESSPTPAAATAADNSPSAAQTIVLPEKVTILGRNLVLKNQQQSEAGLLGEYIPADQTMDNFDFMFAVRFAKGENLDPATSVLSTAQGVKARKKDQGDLFANAETFIPEDHATAAIDFLVSEKNVVEHNYWKYIKHQGGLLAYQLARRQKMEGGEQGKKRFRAFIDAIVPMRGELDAEFSRKDLPLAE